MRWKLKETMARYGIKAKDLAAELGISANSVTSLRQSTTMPRLDGDQLDLLLFALGKLANTHIGIDGLIEASSPIERPEKPFVRRKN